MKILLVHNYYGSSSPSGENVAYQQEKQLLVERGHVVFEFNRDSDSIRGGRVLGPIRGGCSTPWNPWVARAVKEVVAKERPDVVHVHNTFPLISPSIFSSIGKTSAKVFTLHNYRIFCPAAIPVREGVVCTECMEAKSVKPAIRYGCYRGSRIATMPLAGNVALHRRLYTWERHVDAFIALSDFQRDLMVNSGLPGGRVFVKPNFFPGKPAVFPWGERGDYIVYVGRLSSEKGVHTLIDAWRGWGAGAPELRLIGDGPLRKKLEEKAETLPMVKVLGCLGSEDAYKQIAKSRLLVLPSECFEGFPMVLREAFAFGTPSVVSNLGPLPSIVRDGCNGLVFQARDWECLLRTLRNAWHAPEELERMGTNARVSFESLYNENSNYVALMNIYEKAIVWNKGC